MSELPSPEPKTDLRPLHLLRNWAVMAVAVILADLTAGSHIRFHGPASLVMAVLLISAFNAVIKPILVIFAMPFVLLTLGLGLLVINALLFWMVGSLGLGFTVTGFWPALWGATLLGLGQFVCDQLWGERRFQRAPSGLRFEYRRQVSYRTAPASPPRERPARRRIRDDDAIDI